jgi:hypothetical protein
VSSDVSDGRAVPDAPSVGSPVRWRGGGYCEAPTRVAIELTFMRSGCGLHPDFVAG